MVARNISQKTILFMHIFQLSDLRKERLAIVIANADKRIRVPANEIPFTIVNFGSAYSCLFFKVLISQGRMILPG